MALAVTLLTSDTDSGMGAGSWTSADFTPANSSLLVVMLGVVDAGSGNIAASLTCTDNLGSPLTYTPRITNGQAGGYASQSKCWTAPVTTGALMHVIFDCGANSINSSNWFVFQVTGHDNSTPTGGIASAADTTADGAVSLTLSIAPASGDYVLGMVSLDGDTSGTIGVTPGATYSESGEVGSTGTATYAEAEQRTGSTSTTADWVDIQTGSMATYSSARMAIVIKVAAAGPAAPVLAYLTGFEWGVATPVISGGGIANTVNGPIAVGNAYAHTGSYGLRCPAVGAQTNWAKTVGAAAQSLWVISFYFRVPSWSASTHQLFSLNTAAAYCYLQLITGTHVLQARVTGGSWVNGPTLSLDTWYKVDLKIDVSGATNTLDWKVNGTDYTQATSAAGLTTGTTISLGVLNAVTAEVWYDDLAVSFNLSDFPLDVIGVEGLSPDTDGTHNGGTNVIEDQAGTDIVSPGYTTAHDLVNSVPIGNNTTYIKQSNLSTTNYAELLFADTANSKIIGVEALLSYMSSGTSSNQGATIIIDEDATETTVWGSPASRADYSESSAFYKSVILPNPAGTWDAAAVNALKSRVGYSNDVTPFPYWLDLLLEVGYGTAGGTTTPQAVSGAVSTITGVTAKRDNKLATGAVSTIVGGVARKALKGATGAVATITGALARQTNKKAAGTILAAQIVGTLATIKTKVLAVAGAVGTITGALQKRDNKPASGAVGTIVGVNVRRVNKTVSGAVATITGALIKFKIFFVICSGGVTPAGGELFKLIDFF